jgi:hypothetical protein
MIKIIQNEDKSYDLFDSKNQVKITNESFEYIKCTWYFFIVRKQGKYGVYNRKGVLLENCDYLEYYITEHSKCVVLKKTKEKSPNSKLIILSKTIKCNEFFNRLSEVPSKLEDGSHSIVLTFGQYPNSGDQLWNTKKGFIFPPGNSINVLTDKTLEYEISSDRFIINYYGKIIKKQPFKEIYGYISGASLAKTSNKFGLIDEDGEWIKGYENLEYNENSDLYYNYKNWKREGLLPFERNGNYGLINFKENLILESISNYPMFFKQNGFSEIGYSQITINDLSGIIDNHLNWIIEPVFNDFRLAFSHYYLTIIDIYGENIQYIVKSLESNKYGLLSYDGKWLCEPIYDNIKQNVGDEFMGMNENYLIFQLNRLQGIIHKSGIEYYRGDLDIVNLDYFVSEMGNWEDDNNFMDEHKNICVDINNLKGLLDSKGKWILKPVYEKIQGFFKPFRHYYMDEEDLGQDELNEIAQRERFQGKNRCVVRLNGQNMIVDKKGKIIEYLP